jgi:transcriptional regulator with XRE-family HTH domain
VLADKFIGMSGQEIRLKDLIKAAGLNYRELARRLGTTSAHVTYWNQGKTIPSFRTAYRMAKELGVTMDELASAFGYDRDSEELVRDEAIE